MMLVISVIVALAILAVLMNIIGGVGGIGAGEPDKLMHDQLKDVIGKGYGYSSVKKATFSTGRITVQQVIGQDITSVIPDEINFKVKSGDPISDKLTATDAKLLVISNKVEASFVVCGNMAAGANPKFIISIARNENDAASECTIP